MDPFRAEPPRRGHYRGYTGGPPEGEIAVHPRNTRSDYEIAIFSLISFICFKKKYSFRA